MKKRIIPVLLCLLLLAGCTPAAEGPTATPVVKTPTQTQTQPPAQTAEPSAPEISFADFSAAVNEGRRALMAADTPLPDLKPYLKNYADELGTFTPEEAERLITPRPAPTEPVTAAQAAEDVNTLFLMLKTSYGGYHYFGGDEVFLPIRDAVLADLEKQETVSSSELETLLADRLSAVLRDGHFTIGSRGMLDGLRQNAYYVPNLYFDDVSGLDMDYVKPTIGPDGAITYCFTALSNDVLALPSTMGGYSLRWKRMTWRASVGMAVFEETEQDGVPFLVSRKMMERDDVKESKAQLERFSSCGGEYRDKDLFVIDVRANSGGYSNYGMDWFKGFTGHDPDVRKVSAKKHSDLFRAINRRRAQETGNPPSDYPPDGEWSIYESEGEWNEREGTIFVLMDGGTASSGEEMAQNMATVDNVVFVGANTGGVYLISSNNYFYLPHTAMPVFFGQGLFLGGDGENRDGIGFLPDLWVNPADAQDAVLRLIDYYGLREKET